MRAARGFYGAWYGRKVRLRWWSLVNWLRGYKFGAVQRFRCCDHTTPFHYATCPYWLAHEAQEENAETR